MKISVSISSVVRLASSSSEKTVLGGLLGLRGLSFVLSYTPFTVMTDPRGIYTSFLNSYNSCQLKSHRGMRTRGIVSPAGVTANALKLLPNKCMWGQTYKRDWSCVVLTFA